MAGTIGGNTLARSREALIAADLHLEVRKLRTWLGETGASVDGYPAWWAIDGVIGALDDFVTHTPPDAWTAQNVEDLLCVLEHSTTDYAVELATRTEPMALAIARHALAQRSVAGDDIAARLGHCLRHREEAESLLMAFVQDPHERTRRMALLSLAQMRSAAVPALAAAAWNSGDEYQRIGALAALRLVDSGLLPEYVARALEDGRPHLLANARKHAEDAARPSESA